MVFPAASGRLATSTATFIAAPALGPTIMPSACAILVAHSMASAEVAQANSSMTPRASSLIGAPGFSASMNGGT